MEFLAHGQNLVRISHHLPTCPKCAPWNGVIVALAEPTEEYPHTLEEARAAGLFHARCLHSMSFFVSSFSEPGPSEPDYSEEAGKPRSFRGVGGFASGKAGDADGYSTLIAKTPLDFNDKKAIEEACRKFAEDTADSPIEKAIVFSPDGHRYDIDGTKITVGVHLAGNDALKNAVTIHNHPGFDADSFSKDDFASFFQYELSRMDVVYNGKRHRMEWVGKQLTEAEARDVYDHALRSLRTEAMKGHIEILDEQHEVMKHLAHILKGLIFHEF